MTTPDPNLSRKLATARSTPASRKTDPATSLEAEREITKSGRRTNQHLEVLNLVRRFPGSTSAELANFGKLDRYTPPRRLPELERAELVERGLPRRCSVRGTRQATWWPRRIS